MSAENIVQRAFFPSAEGNIILGLVGVDQQGYPDVGERRLYKELKAGIGLAGQRLVVAYEGYDEAVLAGSDPGSVEELLKDANQALADYVRVFEKRLDVSRRLLGLGT